MEPSAYLRPSCSTAGWIDAASGRASSVLTVTGWYCGKWLNSPVEACAADARCLPDLPPAPSAGMG
eukprot:312662-Chlamydomonas_euryale.AAC.1